MGVVARQVVGPRSQRGSHRTRGETSRLGPLRTRRGSCCAKSLCGRTRQAPSLHCLETRTAGGSLECHQRQAAVQAAVQARRGRADARTGPRCGTPAAASRGALAEATAPLASKPPPQAMPRTGAAATSPRAVDACQMQSHRAAQRTRSGFSSGGRHVNWAAAEYGSRASRLGRHGCLGATRMSHTCGCAAPAAAGACGTRPLSWACSSDRERPRLAESLLP